MRKYIRRKLSNWKLTIGIFAVWLVLGILTELAVTGEATLGTPEADFAVVVLELIALTLPALAISLQVVLRYSDRPFLAVGGQSVSLRKISFLAAGLAGSLLFVATRLIMKYLAVSSELELAVELVSYSILLFSAIPLAIGLFLVFGNSSELSAMLDVHHLYDELEELSDREEEEYRAIIEAASIEGSKFAEVDDGSSEFTDPKSPLRTEGSTFYSRE